MDFEDWEEFEQRDREEGASRTGKSIRHEEIRNYREAVSSSFLASKMCEEDKKGKAGESDWGQLRGIQCQRPFIS